MMIVTIKIIILISAADPLYSLGVNDDDGGNDDANQNYHSYHSHQPLYSLGVNYNDVGNDDANQK